MDTYIFGLPHYTDSIFRVKPRLVDIAEPVFYGKLYPIIKETGRIGSL